MTWNDKDEARKVHKFLKCGVLYPEDLTQNELRLLREYRPVTFHYIKFWLEYREEQISEGNWSEDADPPDTDLRINRLENGESVVEPYEPE